MTPERYQQVKGLFESALELDASQWSAFLAEACRGDDSLRSEVEILLGAQPQAESFIEAPAFQAMADLLGDIQEKSLVGQQIGSYRIIREIGLGGMGAVCLATRADDQYQKQVAIKFIKRGMHTEFIVLRFLSERQILANLNHPNIARLYDGGTTEDGLPYFVMEYIDGLPIDYYCDERRLSIVERLKLFRTVCSAVHYAHQNLVIHRDIKPSNILVTADGVPKLLDFGIAKLLARAPSAENSGETATAMRIMTPEYASPEQVRGGVITTSCDTYSLGLLLYKLLTGHPPHRFKNRTPYDIERIICEEEPDKPSTAINRIEETLGGDGVSVTALTPQSVSGYRSSQPKKLRRSLRNDLDNIVLMAMRKEPQRRYASVEQFSEDILRHLEGLPVIARKDTVSYRSGKFIKRHKMGVAAAALILLVLLAGVVGVAWQAKIARNEKGRAERRFNDVRKLANSVLFKYYDPIEKLPGSTSVRVTLVKDVLDYLDSLAQEASDDLSLQLELATAYEKVGDVQGNPYFGNRGDLPGALASYQKALKIREALAAKQPDMNVRRDLAKAYERIGDILANAGDVDADLRYQHKALDIRQALVAADETNLDDRRALATSYSKAGQALAWTGDRAEALTNHNKALSIREELSQTLPEAADIRQELSTSYINIGDSLAADDAAGALKNFSKAFAISDALWRDDKTNAKARRLMALSYGKVGEMLAAKGDFAGSLENQRKALAIRQDLWAKDQTNAQAHRDLAVSYAVIGNTLLSSGKLSGALENLNKSLGIFRHLYEADQNNTLSGEDLGIAYNMIGSVQASGGRVGEAIESYRKALTIVEKISSKDPTDIEALRGLMNSCSNLGDLYAGLASNTKNSSDKQSDYWRLARSFYERSYRILLDLRVRGALSDSEARQLDLMASGIDKCDAALATKNSSQH